MCSRNGQLDVLVKEHFNGTVLDNWLLEFPVNITYLQQVPDTIFHIRLYLSTATGACVESNICSLCT
jgi:hypothetical protein